MIIPRWLRFKILTWCHKKTESLQPSLIIEKDGDFYMRRYVFYKNKFFSIYFHVIMREDADQELHDHPWNFISIIVYGSYVEQLRYKKIIRREGSIAFRRATTAHRIAYLPTRLSYTLIIRGRRIREWYFWKSDRYLQWSTPVPWREFVGIEDDSC